MRQRYRLYKRKKGGRYYIHDDVTGKQESLGTSDRATAVRLFHSRREADQQPAVNLQIARAYSYHAIMVTAARLLSRMPVIHETRYAYDDDEDELESWLRYHQLVRNDGHWLADRRDPAPLKRRDWIKHGVGKDWMWGVNADDFYDCLCNQGC